MRAAKGVLPFNFLEGMACKGGCINGAGGLSHDERNRQRMDAYADMATHTIEEYLDITDHE